MADSISQEDLNRAAQRLASEKKTYDEMGRDMVSLIRNILFEKDMPFQVVNYRVKSEESLKRKMEKQKRTFEEIKDLLGLRVIAYLKSNAKQIHKIIEEEFEVNNSLTKAGCDTGKNNYKGKNYIVRISEKRKNLPEYSRYKDIEFEIQIITVLNHAWAEIQHDRSYKFKELPIEFKSQFDMLAASLELLDQNFDSLCSKVDVLRRDIEKKTIDGDILGIGLDAISLRAYLDGRFKKYLLGKPMVPIFGKGDNQSSLVLTDLKAMNIESLEDLEKIVPTWIDNYLTLQKRGIYNYNFLIADLLVIRFKDEYLKVSKVFSEGGGEWEMSLKEHELLMEKGINYPKLCEQHNIKMNVKQKTTD